MVSIFSWAGDREVVKRSGRDESIRVVIHLCMEAILGISLHSCLYLKIAKILCLSCYCLCILFNTIGEEGKTGSSWKREGMRGEGGCRGGGGGREEKWPKQCKCTYE
jgi:hypothetical protein